MLLEMYLMKIQEFRAENVVQFCRSLQCPRKRLKCLLRLRMDGWCKYDIECQKSVDREIEFLYGQFDNQGGKLVDPLINSEEFPELPIPISPRSGLNEVFRNRGIDKKIQHLQKKILKMQKRKEKCKDSYDEVLCISRLNNMIDKTRKNILKLKKEKND